MLIFAFLGIVLVSSQRIAAQLQDLSEYQISEWEDSFQEDSQSQDDIHYDDDAWFEIEYKIQQLLQNGDEDWEEEFEKSLRGIPLPSGGPKVVNCVEKLYGPFYTIEGSPTEEHIYPARYFNISCVHHNDKSHHYEHHKQMAIKCAPAGNRACVTTVKEVPVFRKTPNKHSKNCWKPEKLIPVETGCKCVHVM